MDPLSPDSSDSSFIVHGNVRICKRQNDQAVKFDEVRILTHPSPIVDVCWMNEPSRTWLLCLMETGAVTLWDMTRVSTLFAIVSRS